MVIGVLNKMLKSDSQSEVSNNGLSNIHSITIDVVCAIQKDLPSYDVISLVFLLYEIPDTALQHLIVFQRTSVHTRDNNSSLLHDWVIHAQQRPTWKYEFLEALSICQLYSVIRKLGFDVSSVNNHYLPNNLHTAVYINPMKKILYKLCESMTSDILFKFKKTLLTYDIDTTEYDACELVILKLMCEKFITVNHHKGGNYNGTDVQNLTGIIEHIAGVKHFALILREVESKINNKIKVNGKIKPNVKPTDTSPKILNNKENVEDKYEEGFTDVYKLMNEMHLNDLSLKNLKSDTKELSDDNYTINNTDRVGVCYIINQEKFYPSQRSIQSKDMLKLDDRYGSTKDKIVLEKTFKRLNFDVITHDNLECKKMIESIKNIVNYRIQPNDSIFILCILSHGYRGHVYAADSVEVNVDDIQKILDSDEAENLRNKPKIMILQACQVEKEEATPIFVADAPSSSYQIKKLDFLIYWATAPEYEAFRNEEQGSIFIQLLCSMIQKYSQHYHLSDIFTKVTNRVTHTCTILKRAQVPIFKSTLRKNLYLHVPK